MRILIIIVWLVIVLSNSQNICENIYNSSDVNEELPSGVCNEQQYSCTIDSITRLMVNSSDSEYGLCIYYQGYSLYFMNIMDERIMKPVIIYGYMVQFESVNISLIGNSKNSNMIGSGSSISINNCTLNLTYSKLSGLNIQFNINNTIYNNNLYIQSSILNINSTSFQILNNTNLNITNQLILSSIFLSSPFFIISPNQLTISITNSSFNITNYTSISSYSFYLTQSTYISSNLSIYSNIITFQNSSLQLNLIYIFTDIFNITSSNLQSSDYLFINSTNSIIQTSTLDIDNSTYYADTINIIDSVYKHRFIYIQVDDIYLQNSTLYSTQFQCNSECSCKQDDSEDTCFIPPTPYSFPILWTNSTFNLQNVLILYPYQFYPNFTLIIISTNQTLINQSILESSIIGLFSNQISIINQSKIKTDGRGCQSLIGQGCGYFDTELNQLLTCTGTGGSYGGLGGNSSPLSCQLLVSRPIYGNPFYPVYTGSGGGSTIKTNHSVGGGVVYIQSYSLQIDENSSVSSDGSASIAGGGGGSGGSINIHVALLIGNGSITALGGNGRSSGGGGRISISYAFWFNQSFVDQNYIATSQMQVSANSGEGCTSQLSCGGNGSIIVSLCLPGYYLKNNFLCVPCDVGTFKSTFGYENCNNCSIRPQNSDYDNKIGSTNINDCSFFCSHGYKNYQNKCVSQFIYVSSFFSGENIMISIFMIIGTVIGYGIIICVDKLFYSKTPRRENPQSQKSQKQFWQKPLFQIEQIPYHEFRIYLSGTNTMDDPWMITNQGFGMIENRFLNSAFFQQYVNRINMIGKYTKYQKGLLFFLKFYYFPLYFYSVEKFKQSKAKQLLKLIKRMKKDPLNSNQIAIKLNVKPNNSVACLQIFDYKKSELDYQLQTYFPFLIVIQKKLLGGYILDFNDPFLKILISNRDNRMKNRTNYQSLYKYFQQLNQLLTNIPQAFDPVFSHLADSSRYDLQIYLFQPPNNILNLHPKQKYMEDRQLILVIVQQNKKCKHFFISKPLPDFKFKQIQRLKWELQRKNYYKQQYFLIKYKWPIKNKFRKNILVWCLLLNIVIQIINQSIIFYNIMNLHTTHSFLISIIVIYFFILPFSQFLASLMAIYWSLKPQHKIGVYSVLLTFAALVKAFILSILAIVFLIKGSPNQNQGETNQYPYYFLMVGNFIILLVMFYIQRLLLWCCRND